MTDLSDRELAVERLLSSGDTTAIQAEFDRWVAENPDWAAANERAMIEDGAWFRARKNCKVRLRLAFPGEGAGPLGQAAAPPPGKACCVLVTVVSRTPLPDEDEGMLRLREGHLCPDWAARLPDNHPWWRFAAKRIQEAEDRRNFTFPPKPNHLKFKNGKGWLS